MAVPTFFFVSALLFYKNCRVCDYVDIIRRKIRTLLVPYILWNLICWPLKEVKNILQYGEISETSPIIIVQKILISEWDPVLWFIRILFLYFLIYPVVLWVVKRKVLFWGTVLANVVLNIVIGPVTGYSTMRYWLPIYMVGAYLSYWHYDVVLGEHKRNKTIIFLAILLQILFIMVAYKSDLGLYICRMISPLLIWRGG